VRLLKRAGVRGFVFPAASHGVPFVCDAPAAEVARARCRYLESKPSVPHPLAEYGAQQVARRDAYARLIATNTMVLLRYHFGAGHAVQVNLYVGPTLAGQIEADFGTGQIRFDEAPFRRHAHMSDAMCRSLQS
jgi:hypothetical protein